MGGVSMTVKELQNTLRNMVNNGDISLDTEIGVCVTLSNKMYFSDFVEELEYEKELNCLFFLN